MSDHASAARLDAIAARAAARTDACEVRFAASMPKHGWSWSWTEPGARPRYFVASVTKLATAAIVFQQVDEGSYGLETPAHALLPPGTLDGLHPRADRITVEHLLSHTSGIADYFEGRGTAGSSLYERILRADEAWERADALDMVRGVAPSCEPGDQRRAHYSDTNFQLLQLILESVDGVAYADVVRHRITEPLDLRDTYVFTPDTLDRYDDIAGILHGTDPLRMPRAMASFGADGSLVSTAAEQATLLEAYLGGRLFSPALVRRATERWRPAFFPFDYGIGTMRYQLPRWMTLGRRSPAMVGHSGASGAILFQDRERGLTIAGSVNQIKNRSLVFRVLSALEREIR